MERSSASLIGRADWTHTPQAVVCAAARGRDVSANKSGRSRSSCTRTWCALKAMRGLVQSRSGNFARDWRAARQREQEDRRPWRVRALGVHGRRGIPVRLVGKIGRSLPASEPSLQVAHFKLVLASRAFFLRALPAADPRDAVRRSRQPRLPRAGQRVPLARHSTTTCALRWSTEVGRGKNRPGQRTVPQP